MLRYISRRFVQLAILLWIVSILTFIIIQLPPGDFVTRRMMQLRMSGAEVGEAEVQRLYSVYGLDKPLYVQYFKWIWNIVRYGDLGFSFGFNEPVREVIGDRILLTMVISFFTIMFVYLVGIPIGIYSATHQYSLSDYGFTFVGFIGLAIPNFLLALILMYVLFIKFGASVTGLFSPEYALLPWSLARVWDMLKHLGIPVIVIGTAGTAGLIRITRGCLLDELRKQYVITARAKGMPEKKLLFKYPVRMAVSPIVSTIGWMLPAIISGEAVTAIVLNLPTTGTMLLEALLQQDMFLAGSFIMILSALTVSGTLISDILLVWVDPRIRYERRSR